MDALIRLTECQFSTQAYGASSASARLAFEVAPAAGELAVHRARLWIARTRGLTDPSFDSRDGLPEIAAASASFEAAGDVDGLLDAETMRMFIHLNHAHWRECARAARNGWERARATGRDRRRDEFAGWLANALAWGTEPVDSGLAIIDELLRATTRRSERAELLACAAHLHAYAGDPAAVEAAWSEGMAIRMELGLTLRGGDFRRAEIDHALGDPVAALAAARRSEALLAEAGETGMRSSIVGIAGDICLDLGDLDEALRLAAESQRLTAPDDAVSQILWRRIEGVARARRGEHDEADRLTGEAVALAATTDSIEIANAWLARAEVLQLAGRFAEARAAAADSRTAHAAKGFVHGVRRAEARLAELDALEPA